MSKNKFYCEVCGHEKEVIVDMAWYPVRAAHARLVCKECFERKHNRAYDWFKSGLKEVMVGEAVN